MKQQEVVLEELALMSRLAVIESKIETVLQELSAIRGYVPTKIIEHTERLNSLERGLRCAQWLAGVFAVAIVGAFIAHVFGG